MLFISTNVTIEYLYHNTFVISVSINSKTLLISIFMYLEIILTNEPQSFINR